MTYRILPATASQPEVTRITAVIETADGQARLTDGQREIAGDAAQLLATWWQQAAPALISALARAAGSLDAAPAEAAIAGARHLLARPGAVERALAEPGLLRLADEMDRLLADQRVRDALAGWRYYQQP